MSNPPVPFELAKLRGNPGKRRLRPEPQPMIEAEPPAPPDWLSSYAREEWFRVAPQLHHLRLLSLLDIAPFAAYCEAYSTWRTVAEVLARFAERDETTRGLLIKSTEGPKANPLVRIASRAAEDMVSFASQFGMTAIARTRIAHGAGWQSRGGGKFDGLLG
jgi:P27 family predicted phage terminase small subunit